ncbi:uncharacterized protein LOC62_03G003991 [Vanrija pseudolonga]|uniref:Uncharacterized protein n=1 Tax=Vanrija pseudolonga TaxID=143232 RepID=A0AAF0Y9S5_9TREE|nr:hypothetical protein LOC62_03G003991 [Vanrija pseudolonga]
MGVAPPAVHQPPAEATSDGAATPLPHQSTIVPNFTERGYTADQVAKHLSLTQMHDNQKEKLERMRVEEVAILNRMCKQMEAVSDKAQFKAMRASAPTKAKPPPKTTKGSRTKADRQASGEAKPYDRPGSRTPGRTPHPELPEAVSTMPPYPTYQQVLSPAATPLASSPAPTPVPHAYSPANMSLSSTPIPAPMPLAYQHPPNGMSPQQQAQQQAQLAAQEQFQQQQQRQQQLEGFSSYPHLPQGLPQQVPRAPQISEEEFRRYEEQQRQVKAFNLLAMQARERAAHGSSTPQTPHPDAEHAPAISAPALTAQVDISQQRTPVDSGVIPHAHTAPVDQSYDTPSTAWQDATPGPATYQGMSQAQLDHVNGVGPSAPADAQSHHEHPLVKDGHILDMAGYLAVSTESVDVDMPMAPPEAVTLPFPSPTPQEEVDVEESMDDLLVRMGLIPPNDPLPRGIFDGVAIGQSDENVSTSNNSLQAQAEVGPPNITPIVDDISNEMMEEADPITVERALQDLEEFAANFPYGPWEDHLREDPIPEF